MDRWLATLCIPALALSCADPPGAAQNAQQPETPSVGEAEADGGEPDATDAANPKTPDLDDSSAATGVQAPPQDGPRVYAKTRFVWVRPGPSPVGWVGYLWLGGNVKLKSAEPAIGPGCPGPENNSLWYAIEPFGYVCVDGKDATLDSKDPALVATLPYAPRLDSPWPHEYGESRGIQKYKQLPTRAQQRAREWDLPEHEAALETARAPGAKPEELDKKLIDVDLSIPTQKSIELGDYPSTLNEPRNRLFPLSTVAYTARVDNHGTPFLLTADMMWVPQTRVARYPKVTFKGLEVGKDIQPDADGGLRIAFFRGEDRTKYSSGSEGFTPRAAEVFKRLSWVKLTGKSAEQDGTTYLETTDAGAWVQSKQAVVPEFRTETPWGAAMGKPDSTGEAPPGRATWMEANVWKGWLIAYEGTRVVYVTLISPGRGGTPAKGIPAIDTAATPTGSFKITGKFATATMAAPQEYIHSDVPWTQNFSGPHAIHGAYWHDNWGERMSAGCVNLSPEDGRWLYNFTEPAVPEGWHGVRWRPSVEPATLFIVR